MRIAAADLKLSAQHALTQTQTRRETLAAGMVTGGWNADAVDVTRERESDLPPEGAAPSRQGGSLLDDYLRQLSPERARQVRAARDGREGAGETTGVREARDARGGRGAEAETGAAAAASMAGARTRTLDLASLLSGGLPDPAALRSVLDGLGTEAGGAADLLTRVQSLLDDGEGPSGSELLQRIQALSTATPVATVGEPQAGSAEQLRMDLIRSAVEAFTGRRLRLLSLSDLDLGGDTYAAQSGSAPEGAEPAPPVPTFGLAYEVRDTRTERETTSFQARGVVRTADGEEIDVDVNLTMDRELVRESSSQVRVGAALRDPLVVNYGGTAAELTQRTFAFDVDTDGQTEQIHFVGPGSGFLAWDRNANGAVDDGSELFGPATGQGFAELAAHDDDGNGFIDEGDAIWADLQIWEKDGAGSDRLLAVGQRGVGAIYLGNADTPFQVTDAAGQQQGQVRSTGIYLREDGGAGTVQHLDLVV